MRLLLFASLSVLAACGHDRPLDPWATYGPDPELTQPSGGGLFPTVKTADPIGWDETGAPIAPAGFTVTRYAEGLDHPRWLYLMPNGDVMVAESSTEPADGGGIMGWIRNRIQAGAGALGESADRITLLRDEDGDGDVDSTYAFAENLNQPFGMALLGEHFYIANTDAVVRLRYTPGALRAPGAPERVLDIPYNAESNGHWTRNLAVSPDGTKLYVAVGSVSNIPTENGWAAEEGRAAVWELSPDGSGARLFATGLRNPVGMEFEPSTGALWVAVNERDMLGDDLVPDYMTSVRDGGFYGWPYSYFGQHVDERVKPQDPARVAAAIRPDFALGAHTASLGLHFYRGDALPARFHGGAFVGQHGSWNRSEPSGYKVVFVPFANGSPSGQAEDFLTGFLNEDGDAHGRPVGVATDRTGALLVADDVGNIIWRIAPTAQ